MSHISEYFLDIQIQTKIKHKKQKWIPGVIVEVYQLNLPIQFSSQKNYSISMEIMVGAHFFKLNIS